MFLRDDVIPDLSKDPSDLSKDPSDWSMKPGEGVLRKELEPFKLFRHSKPRSSRGFCLYDPFKANFLEASFPIWV
jgi:hypothetical protein